MKCSLSILPETFDIDEGEDLRHLLPLANQSKDLTATRAALCTHGLLSQSGVA